MMIESVKKILDKYGIKEEKFIEAVKELCSAFDVKYGLYPDCMYEGYAIYNFLTHKTDGYIDLDDWAKTTNDLQKRIDDLEHTAIEKSEY